MKNIYISGIQLCKPVFVGISRYCFETLRCIDLLFSDTESRFKLFLVYPSGRTIKVPPFRHIEVVQLDCHKKRFRIALRDYVGNNGIICEMGPTIAYSSHMIVTHHDVREFESFRCNTFKKKLVRMVNSLSLRFFDCTVVTVSDFQKERIESRLGIQKDKIRVIGNGWEHIKRFKEDTAVFDAHPNIMKGAYYYTLGSMAPHKNYKWIYEVAKRNPGLQFVVAGNIDKKIWGMDNSDMQCGNVEYLGYITDEENIALMNGCKAYIHPAIYEGFGIPPLEALALGKKIIISKSTCLPEIYGNSARYFAPDDYDVDLVGLSEEVTYDAEDVLKKHTWSNAAKCWLDLFGSVSK